MAFLLIPSSFSIFYFFTAFFKIKHEEVKQERILKVDHNLSKGFTA